MHRFLGRFIQAQQLQRPCRGFTAVVSAQHNVPQQGRLRLQDKVAIVTGGAKGIGKATTELFAREGAAVVVADVLEVEAAAVAQRLVAAGCQAAAVRCNVSSAADVERMVQSAVQQYGRLDIMVANAGIVRAAPFLEMSEADFDEVIAVNLKGAFLSCQAAARQMVRQLQQAQQVSSTSSGTSASSGPGYSIITMSSVNAIMAIPTIAGYNAAKGGVNNLTRCMALALAQHGIRVNAIGPGSIRTEVLDAVVSDKAAMDKVLSRTPLGRIGEPEEVARIALFLASDDSSYITGETIYADGGRLALNYTVPVPQ